MNLKVRVYYWNPNGTNDIEIVNTKTLKVVETIPEALFGINTGANEWTLIPIERALRQVACSPVDDGSDIAAKLMRYLNGGVK